MQRTVDDCFNLLSNFMECAGYEISDDLSVKRLSPLRDVWMPSEATYKEMENLVLTHGLGDPADVILRFIHEMNNKRVMAADWELKFKQWFNDAYQIDELNKLAF